MIRTVNKLLLSAVVSCLFIIWNVERTIAQDEKPNIIIILADDLGRGDLGYYGSDILTPHLDQLAREAVVLDRYYVAPVCSPTRAGLMTGRYPDRIGLRETVIPPWSTFGVDLGEQFLPEFLGKAGYKHRAILGKWHLGHADLQYHPLQRGFTHFYGHYNGAIDYFTHKREGELDWHNDYEPSFDKGYSTDLIAQEAVKCIKNYRKDGPFFIYMAFNAPHAPLQAKQEDLELYGFDMSKPLIESRNESYGHQGRGNTERQTYAAMVTAMDRGIGQVLEELKRQGLEENTLVLFHSDNGPAPGEGGTTGGLRGRKFEEWDGGVRAPAFIKWPKGFSGGRLCTQLTGYIDVLPTVLDIVGLGDKLHKPLDGISILPVLKNDLPNLDRSFYLGAGAGIENEWKLVKAGGNARIKIKEDHLFNMVSDPQENTNVADKHPEQYHQILKWVNRLDELKPERSVPPYGQGRGGFVAPKNWKIEK